jgi:predicted dithiol-disulfide oxidoreductase (DUF899 family)
METLEPKTQKSEVNPTKVVSRAEWLVARKDLLTREKDLTRLRDEVSRHRRDLPWVKIERQRIASRSVCGTQSIDRLSFYARARLGGRLQKLLVLGGPL